jgi:putative membrane protein
MKLIKKHGYEFLLSDEFRKQIKKEMSKNLEKME